MLVGWYKTALCFPHGDQFQQLSVGLAGSDEGLVEGDGEPLGIILTSLYWEFDFTFAGAPSNGVFGEYVGLPYLHSIAVGRERAFKEFVVITLRFRNEHVTVVV